MNRVERFRVGKWAELTSGRLTPKASVFVAESIGSVGGTIKGGVCCQEAHMEPVNEHTGVCRCL